MDYNFHWRPVFKSLPDLLESALLTLEVAILSMILGILFGLVLSLIRIKMTGPLKWFAVSWIELARNTPALLQLFFFGFGLGAFGIHFSPFSNSVIGLNL
jgi:polar amino acid transport system permease protein